MEANYLIKIKLLGVTFQENHQWADDIIQCIISANKGINPTKSVSKLTWRVSKGSNLTKAVSKLT